MSGGAGFMANYCRGRARLESIVNEWRGRVGARVNADRLAKASDAFWGHASDEIAELRLTLATMIRLLRTLNLDCSRENDTMPTGASVFEKYLHESSLADDDRQSDSLDIAPEQPSLVLAELGELKLVVASMLKMLIDRRVLTTQQLQEMADEIDSLDGKADGKLDGRLSADGTIAVPEPEPASPLDELSQAVQQREDKGRKARRR